MCFLIVFWTGMLGSCLFDWLKNTNFRLIRSWYFRRLQRLKEHLFLYYWNRPVSNSMYRCYAIGYYFCKACMYCNICFNSCCCMACCNYDDCVNQTVDDVCNWAGNGKAWFVWPLSQDRPNKLYISEIKCLKSSSSEHSSIRNWWNVKAFSCRLNILEYTLFRVVVISIREIMAKKCLGMPSIFLNGW